MQFLFKKSNFMVIWLFFNLQTFDSLDEDDQNNQNFCQNTLPLRTVWVYVYTTSKKQQLFLFPATISKSNALNLVCQCGIVLQNKDTSEQAIIITSGTQNTHFPQDAGKHKPQNKNTNGVKISVWSVEVVLYVRLMGILQLQPPLSLDLNKATTTGISKE